MRCKSGSQKVGLTKNAKHFKPLLALLLALAGVRVAASCCVPLTNTRQQPQQAQRQDSRQVHPRQTPLGAGQQLAHTPEAVSGLATLARQQVQPQVQRPLQQQLAASAVVAGFVSAANASSDFSHDKKRRNNNNNNESSNDCPSELEKQSLVIVFDIERHICNYEPNSKPVEVHAVSFDRASVAQYNLLKCLEGKSILILACLLLGVCLTRNASAN